MNTKQTKREKPVTLITGYLGSGKTTLLNELLKNQENSRLALIVNDMGSINVDASLIKKNSVLEADTKMIEMQNGCICCTLRDAFMVQIEQLAEQEDIDRIIVEASGISNPAMIADGFLSYEDGMDSNVYLDSIVTVTDADRIYTEFLDEMQKTMEDETEGDPDIINLVMDQIEFCNVVILNKCDLVSPEHLEKVKKVIRQLQSEADIIECVHGKVDPKLIFQGKRFDYEKVLNSSLIQKALARENKMEQSGIDEYGISSFVYEERRPFDYDKFMQFVEEDYPDNVIRAKGYIWFADDDMHVQLFEQAGRNATVTEVSNWVAAFSEKDKQEVFDNYPEIMDEWDEQFGDRMNQIVFIGREYEQKKIMGRLDECIVKA